MKLLLLAIFLLPFTNLMIFNNFNVSDLLFLFVFLISLNKTLKLDKSIVIIFILLYVYIFLNLFSLVWVENKSDVFFYILQYIFIFFIVPIAILLNFKTKKEFSSILKSFYVGLISAILLNFILWIVDETSYSSYNGRFFGIYENPWILSYFVVMAISMSLFYFVYSSNTKYRLLNFMLLLIEFYILILAGARTSFVVLFFILFLSIFYFMKDRFSKKLLVIQSLILLMLFSILTFNYKSIVNLILPFIFNISEVTAVKLQTLTEGDLDEGRLSLYASGIEFLYNNPLGWIGLGNYAIKDGISMHNIILSLWIEAGVINVFIILMITCFIVYQLLKYNNSFESRVLLSMLLVLIIFGLFNPVLTLRAFWIPIILSIIYINYERLSYK